MNKLEKIFRIAGAIALFAISAFFGWVAHDVSTSPIPATRTHYVKIPDGAEIKPRYKIHAPSIDPSISRTTDWHNFIVDEPLEKVKSMAEKRPASLLVGYSSEKLEYWLPRGDGIHYYVFETAPPTKKSEAEFSKIIRFDPDQKAFVYSFERTILGIILFGLFTCGFSIFGMIIIFPIIQKTEK